jgi:hypothetical protein
MLTLPDTETATVLEKVAQTLDISEEEALRAGLRSLVQRSLRDVQSRIFQITGRYSVTSVQEMEARYRDGSLDEAESWRDLQALDHLEYKRDQLQALIDLLP